MIIRLMLLVNQAVGRRTPSSSCQDGAGAAAARIRDQLADESLTQGSGNDRCRTTPGALLAGSPFSPGGADVFGDALGCQ